MRSSRIRLFRLSRRRVIAGLFALALRRRVRAPVRPPRQPPAAAPARLQRPRRRPRRAVHAAARRSHAGRGSSHRPRQRRRRQRQPLRRADAVCGARGGRAAAEAAAGRGAPPPPPPPPPAVMPPPVDADRLGDGAIAGSARRPQGRPLGRRPGRLEHAHGLDDAADRQVAGRDALGPGVHRQVRDSGQLQRVRDLRHLEPGEAGAGADAISAPRRRTTCRSTRTCCSCRRKRPTAGPTAGLAAFPIRSARLRVRGIRIFDITDIKNPKLVTSVQTCRGSHTHTVVTQPGDNDNVYIYVSGTSGVRSADELPGCKDGGIDDPNTARFRLEVIKVPLAAPGDRRRSSARRASSTACRCRRAMRSATRPYGGARRCGTRRRAGARGAGARAPAAAHAGAAAGRGAGARRGGGRGGAVRQRRRPPTGPNQCHDITVYPEIGLAGGACAGLGLLLDIRDVAQPGPHRHRRRTPTCRSGTRRPSATTAPRSCSPTSGAADAAALPRHRQAGVGRQRALHDREQQAGVPQLLQAAGAADRRRRTASRTTARSFRFPAAT